MKKIYLLAVLLSVMSTAHAQNTTFRYKVNVNANKYCVKKICYSEIVDSIVLRPGAAITSTREIVNGDTTFKEVIQDTIKKIWQKKKVATVNRCVTDTTFKSSLFVSGDTIFINPWIESKETNNEQHCAFCDRITKCDNDCRYYIQLCNRQSVSFTYSNFEIGAVTIPFKYRFSGTNGGTGKTYTDDAQADINLGIMGGYKVGRIKYVYDKYAGMKTINSWGFTIGPFLGISRLELDTISTSSAKEPLVGETKRAVAVFSYGIGAMVEFRDFRFGAFFGADMAAGQASRQWNYQNKPWLGLGLGYRIPFYIKRE